MLALLVALVAAAYLFNAQLYTIASNALDNYLHPTRGSLRERHEGEHESLRSRLGAKDEDEEPEEENLSKELRLCRLMFKLNKDSISVGGITCFHPKGDYTRKCLCIDALT